MSCEFIEDEDGKLVGIACGVNHNKLGEIVDADKEINTEIIEVISEVGINFKIYNDYDYDSDTVYTLNTILDEWKKRAKAKDIDVSKYLPIIKVICDSYMNGTIYWIGNYPNENEWRVYAKTCGIA